MRKNERARTIREMADFMLENGDHCTRELLLVQFGQAATDACASEARRVAKEHLDSRAA